MPQSIACTSTPQELLCACGKSRKPEGTDAGAASPAKSRLYLDKKDEPQLTGYKISGVSIFNLEDRAFLPFVSDHYDDEDSSQTF